MKYSPRPTQREIMDFAWRNNGGSVAWWATMGAGKSSAAAHYALERLYTTAQVKRWLIVAPKMVAEITWPQEFQKWDSLRGEEVHFITAADFNLTPALRIKRDGEAVDIMADDLRPSERIMEELNPGSVVLGKGALALPDRRGAKKGLLARKTPFSVVSYDFLPWLRRACGVNWPFDGVIVDESVFLKSGKGPRFEAIETARNKGMIQHLLELTGKPQPNGHEDLWAQLLLLDGGKALGDTLTKFHSDWCVPVQTGRNRQGRQQVFRWGVPVDKRAALFERIRNLAISVRHDVGVPLVEVDHLIELPAKARKVHDDLWSQLMYRFDPTSVVLVANRAVLVGKILQVAQGAIYDSDRLVQHLHDEKIERLRELVEMANGPVIVAYPFKHDWDRLSKAFGRHIVKANTRTIEEFKAGRFKILAAHPGSMSHGVDGLQNVCSTIIWFGVTHNSDHYGQLNARAHRPGQEADTVFVHRILANDTLEMDVANIVLPGKIGDEFAVMEAVKARANGRTLY